MGPLQAGTRSSEAGIAVPGRRDLWGSVHRGRLAGGSWSEISHEAPGADGMLGVRIEWAFQLRVDARRRGKRFIVRRSRSRREAVEVARDPFGSRKANPKVGQIQRHE